MDSTYKYYMAHSYQILSRHATSSLFGPFSSSSYHLHLQYLPFEQIDSAFKAIVAHMAPHSIFHGNKCFSTFEPEQCQLQIRTLCSSSRASASISIKYKITRQKQMLLKIMCVRMIVFIVCKEAS